MPELVLPTGQLRDSWLAARDDWGADAHQDGAGLSPADDVDTPQGFSDWVERLRRQSDWSRPVDEGRVHATYWWIVEPGPVVGAIDLRHELKRLPAPRRRTHRLQRAAVIPEAGLATWALGAVLPRARELGMDRVLLTCDEVNGASALTIERNGGVLEDVRDTELGRKRRYWISLH